MSFLQDWKRTFLFLVIIAAAVSIEVSAEQVPGVSANKVRIGSCSALSGPASFLGIQTQMGALAYFHLVNDEGGINGRTIELKSRDDGYDPEHASTCFEELMKDDVFAMGFFVGTPTAAKYIPMADAAKVPVVGLFTGAQMLYEPFKHDIVNVRASYFDETREQIDSLWKIRGVRKIGVIYQDDAFGKTVLEGVEHAMAKYGSAPIALGTFQRNTLDISGGLKTVRQARPEAVIVVGPYAPIAAILKEAHASGWRPLFLTVSFVGTEGLIRAAGPDAEGVVITQVVPAYDRFDLSTIKLYRSALEKYMSGASPSFVSLEGFVDAMVMAHGLKAAGKDLTREKFISGIESLRNHDIGLGRDFLLTYGPRDHKGFDSVYATVVRNGRAEVITDWNGLQGSKEVAQRQ
ncbi:MAG TPA: ABC transporter substrate-binding protein [Terriglobales bacterium]|nr:ABC transporter substrate-binding protein [Terriglobales bacterium]